MHVASKHLIVVGWADLRTKDVALAAIIRVARFAAEKSSSPIIYGAVAQLFKSVQ